MSNNNVKSIYSQAMSVDEPKKKLNKSQEKHVFSNKDLNKDLDKDLNKASKKDVKKHTHKRSSNLPTADEVEEMVFRLRKEPKIRINADFPEDWKKELDEYAHQAGVGKYHLVMFAVGKMLSKM